MKHALLSHPFCGFTSTSSKEASAAIVDGSGDGSNSTPSQCPSALSFSSSSSSSSEGKDQSKHSNGSQQQYSVSRMQGAKLYRRQGVHAPSVCSAGELGASVGEVLYVDRTASVGLAIVKLAALEPHDSAPDGFLAMSAFDEPSETESDAAVRSTGADYPETGIKIAAEVEATAEEVTAKGSKAATAQAATEIEMQLVCDRIVFFRPDWFTGLDPKTGNVVENGAK